MTACVNNAWCDSAILRLMVLVAAVLDRKDP
jgi:hypothetical protein